jgi:hypothetical protein
MIDTYQNICDGFVSTHCQRTGPYNFLGIAKVILIFMDEDNLRVGLHPLLLIVDPIAAVGREALNGIS